MRQAPRRLPFRQARSLPPQNCSLGLVSSPAYITFTRPRQSQSLNQKSDVEFSRLPQYPFAILITLLHSRCTFFSSFSLHLRKSNRPTLATTMVLNSASPRAPILSGIRSESITDIGLTSSNDPRQMPNHVLSYNRAATENVRGMLCSLYTSSRCKKWILRTLQALPRRRSRA